MPSSDDDAGEHFALDLAPDPRLVRTARMFGAAIARRFGCSEETVQDVKVALSEACANATNAHLRSGADVPVRLDVRCAGNVLSFSVIDHGGGFTYESDAHDQALAGAAADPMRILESGIGIGLIRTLFPEVVFVNNDSGGTTVRFDIDLASEHA